MKKYKIVLILVLFFLPLLTTLIIFYTQAAPVSPKETEFSRIEIQKGETAKTAAYKLDAMELIKSQRLFYAAARFPFVYFLLTGNKEPFTLKSGTYKLSGSMNLSEILAILSAGKEDSIRVALPEGLTLTKIAARLENAGVCEKQDFIAAAKDSELLAEYQIPAETFEGYLFPDTYFFAPSTAGSEAIKIMADNFFSHIKEDSAFGDMTMEELNETVILASVVEREYRQNEEAPLIASVFKNRLKSKIGLYSCATVEYVITEIEGREHPDVIKYSDLELTSPYNTYKYAGLPPGAIANPGMTALKAAANPPETDYYYFRLTDAAAGKHVFSKDFSAHIKEGDVFSTKKAAEN
ncbi:MAG: endolytic transglycosylase MltG [Treponema sp.]